MPPISLAVCVHRERELLKRLLENAAGCYDDLLVVHDGPDTNGLREVVEAAGGRFFERPRAFQQEPHWPFAWGAAENNWILRLDADEFPSKELKAWLKEFRESPEPDSGISGYTCIWPLWDGKRAVTKKWPAGRVFLFHRERVRFFGMAEQTPIPDECYQPVDRVLCHQPPRGLSGIANTLFRRQAYHWRRAIINSLLGKPTELQCWRWADPNWPTSWESIRQHPWRSGLFRLVWFPLCNARAQWKNERKIISGDIITPGLNHFLICIGYWWQSRILRHRSARKITR